MFIQMQQQEQDNIPQNFSIQSNLTQQALTIKLFENSNAKKVTVYTAKISTDEFQEKFAVFFSNLSELSEYILAKKHMLLELQSKTLSIIAYLGTKKQKKIIIGSVDLQQKQFNCQQAKTNQKQVTKESLVNECKKCSEIKEQIVRFQKQNKQLKQKLAQLASKYEGMQQKISHFLKKFITYQQFDTVINKQLMLGQKLEKMENKLADAQKFKINQESPQKKLTASEWLDPDFYCKPHVVISGNTVVAKKWASLFGRTRLKYQPWFSATINKMGSIITFGIIQSSYKRSSKLYDKQNRILYRSNKQFFNPDRDQWVKNQGQGFRAGEQVSVTVDLQFGLAEWRVGSSLRYSTKKQILKDSTIDWVPFIYLNDQNDQITICS